MRLIYFVLLTFLFSCKKKVEKADVVNSRIQLEQIKEPQLFYDSIGLGELSGEGKILQIQRFSYGINNSYYFEYVENSKKIKSIFYEPEKHPFSCAFAKCEFFYKNNRVDKIEISAPSSACEVVTRTYQFDYYPIGAVKSVTQINDFEIIETFFSYNSFGRISKIFRSGRSKSDTEYRFSETDISYYQSGNVKDVILRPYLNAITERVSFTYDNAQNPFKQLYIPEEFLSAFGWGEGIPFFLSSNVVNLTTRVYDGNANSHSFPYTVTTNNSRLNTFYYFNEFGSTFYYE